MVKLPSTTLSEDSVQVIEVIGLGCTPRWLVCTSAHFIASVAGVWELCMCVASGQRSYLYRICVCPLNSQRKQDLHVGA